MFKTSKIMAVVDSHLHMHVFKKTNMWTMFGPDLEKVLPKLKLDIHFR